MTPSPTEIENVGLLFVHGIGEQKRFDHLRSTVVEFAELMRQADDGPYSCAIVDRTDDWKLPPGEPHPAGLSPITLHVTGPGRNVAFQCHEVWWADLGERDGISDVIGFWLWGFGQWAAPIYRELDATGLEKKIDVANHRTSKLVKLPKSVSGDAFWEPVSRLQLAVAGLIALLTAATWGLAKRLLQQLLDQAPTPVLLVRYVGDVRTYEERAVPGATALSDPGHPRRVGIRRRMVAEMVTMGARDDLDRWYVVAHSQGTVLAYNGLTEIGHALPNYLSRAHWESLPDSVKSDDVTRRRPPSEIGEMMPARPPWLSDDDIISRPRLFGNLAGFLTYGSPLNKFAGLWPRVVATATDVGPEGAPDSPFPASCRWINLHAPQDPVAGNLSAYAMPPDPAIDGPWRYLPRLETIETRWGFDYLLAHIRYFTGTEGFDKSAGAVQRRRVMRWLIAPESDSGRPVELEPFAGRLTGFARFLHMYAAYLVILGIILVLTSAAVTAAGGLIKAVLGGKAASFASFADFAWATLQAVGGVTVAGSATVLLAGLLRWWRESGLNRKLADAEVARAVASHHVAEIACGVANQAAAAQGTPTRIAKARSEFEAAALKMAESQAKKGYWERVRLLHHRQFRAAAAVGALSIGALFFGGWSYLRLSSVAPAAKEMPLLKTMWALFEWSPMLAVITVCYALAMIVQTLINASVQPLPADASEVGTQGGPTPPKTP